MDNKLDIVVFGATGFTGKFVIRTLSKLSKTCDRQFNWGIAGRSEQKLSDALTECAEMLGYSLNGIPKITADVSQKQTLKEMARRARVIINCCGPFGYYGEAVVKACIDEGTHHLDVSAEVPYMEGIQLKYHKKAEEKGVYVVSACAYESIPVDLGIVFLQQKFGGTLNSVDVILEFWEENATGSGSLFNYSTWESAMYIFEHEKELQTIRQELFPNKLPKFEPELKLKVLPYKSKLLNKWIMPFQSIDKDVVHRSQRNFYEKHTQRPVQIETYLGVKSFITMLLIMICGIFVTLVSKFSIGRKILLKYPEMFSGGLINSGTPTVEKTERLRFSMTLQGEGWKEILPDANHRPLSKPDKTVTAKVSGKNPGYGGTAVILSLAALTVITEIDKMPGSGGVYSPGYAFSKTSLVDRLNKNGICFEILD